MTGPVVQVGWNGFAFQTLEAVATAIGVTPDDELVRERLDELQGRNSARFAGIELLWALRKLIEITGARVEVDATDERSVPVAEALEGSVSFTSEDRGYPPAPEPTGDPLAAGRIARDRSDLPGAAELFGRAVAIADLCDVLAELGDIETARMVAERAPTDPCTKARVSLALGSATNATLSTLAECKDDFALAQAHQLMASQTRDPEAAVEHLSTAFEHAAAAGSIRESSRAGAALLSLLVWNRAAAEEVERWCDRLEPSARLDRTLEIAGLVAIACVRGRDGDLEAARLLIHHAGRLADDLRHPRAVTEIDRVEKELGL